MPRRDAILAYIESCFNPESSGFAMTPGGETTLSSIAQGHVALAVMGESSQHWTRYLLETIDAVVTTAKDVWIASPFLDTVGLTSADTNRWASLILAEQNNDSTWGTGADRAYQTAAHASALLLLGAELTAPNTVGQALLAAQTEDGGWAHGDTLPTHSRLRTAWDEPSTRCI